MTFDLKNLLGKKKDSSFIENATEQNQGAEEPVKKEGAKAKPTVFQ